MKTKRAPPMPQGESIDRQDFVSVDSKTAMSGSPHRPSVSATYPKQIEALRRALDYVANKEIDVMS